MRPSVPLTLAAGLVFFNAAAAAQSTSDDPIRSSVESLNARSSLEAVRDAPVPGLKEVRADGQILYFTADGEYLVVGDIYRVEDRMNLTEFARGRIRADVLATSDRDTHIRYGDADADQVVYVFTDTSCSFCQRWHAEVAELNAAGVTVEYLAWPRGGARSQNLAQMEAAWCDEDRAGAYDALIAGRPTSSAECDSPVLDHYALGEKLGVQGTPAIYSADGRQLGGYLPARAILQALSQTP